MVRLKRWFAGFAATALIAMSALASGATAQAAPGDPELTASTPTISGTLAVGSTIEARMVGWSEGATFRYQWYADRKPISKATAATLKLAGSQQGKRISVTVTGDLEGHASTSRTSAASARVMKAGSPTISGALAVGSTLKAKAGSWTSKTRLTYRWLRDGSAIKGATKSSYKLTTADAGSRISVKVTGKRSGYATVAKTSAATVKVTKPVTPKVVGSAVVGAKLTAEPGRWSPGTQFGYQWSRSGKKIKGATSSTYQVGKPDIDKQLSVAVVGKQSGWATVTRTSARTAKVMKAGTPTISGTVKVGSTVKVKAGSWTSKTKLSYQWLRDGKAIAKATKSSYKLASADTGAQLSVKVTGKRAGYATASRTSAPRTVGAARFTSDEPDFDGYLLVGYPIIAVPGAWTRGTTFTYQWYADDVLIPGATAATFVPTGAQIGKHLSVDVKGALKGFAPLTETIETMDPVPFEGIFKVGRDIARGSWFAHGGRECYWERRSDPEEGPEGIIALGPFHRARTIVTIQPTDSYFYVAGCGEWKPAEQFTDPYYAPDEGDWRVGVNIAPGTYGARGGPECYWWRLDEAGVALDLDQDVLPGVNAAGPFHAGEVIVTIRATDKYFSSTGCGTWVRQAERFADQTIADGDWEVGKNLQPGTYLAPHGGACYWWRQNEAGGDLDSAIPGQSEVIAAGYMLQGQAMVTILDSDRYFTSVGCGTWLPYQPGGTPNDTVGNGDFAVGDHLLPGVWQTTTASGACAWEIATGFADHADIVTSGEGPGPHTITIDPSMRRFSSIDCGTWQRIGDVPTEPAGRARSAGRRTTSASSGVARQEVPSPITDRLAPEPVG